MIWKLILTSVVDRGFRMKKSRIVSERGVSQPKRKRDRLTSALCAACSAGATIALVSITTIGAAHAVTVQPGQTLQVTFKESGPNSVPGLTGAGGRSLDTLSFYETDTSPSASGIARLFNGTTLLGTVNFTTAHFHTFSFTAPGSAYTSPPFGVVNDWTSLIDGTIDGILDITFNKPIDVSIGIENLGIGFSGAGIWNASSLPTITGESVLAATPLPATLPLFASGLGGIGLLRWRRKKKMVQATA